MLVQSPVLATLRSPDSRDRSGALARRCLDADRIGIARHVRDAFGFRAARGKRQLSGFLRASGVLERSGFRHPARRRGCLRPGAWRLRCLRRFRPWTGFRRFGWRRRSNAGCGMLCRILNISTAPRRSPIARSGLWLFRAVALRALSLSAPGPCARDGCIGSRAVERQSRLRQVVCPSRSLIRPGARCQQLASHVPGLALRRVPVDFDARRESALAGGDPCGAGAGRHRVHGVRVHAGWMDGGLMATHSGNGSAGVGQADSWLG